MNYELEYRATIAYLLLIYSFPLIGWRRSRKSWRVTGVEMGDDSHVDRLLASMLQVGPLLIYVFAPEVFLFSGVRWTSVWRWLATIPAVGSILLLIWACRSTEGDADGEELPCGPVEDGPYRWLRHPQFLASSVFFVSLAVLSNSWPVLLCSLAGAGILRLAAAPRIDNQMHETFGPDFSRRLAKTGSFFFKLAAPREAQYVVPRRFGLSALLALMTTFALLFGWFHHINAHPLVYLFTASEITAICLVQIFFGKTPRGASAITGAILLPFWALIMMRSQSIGWAFQVFMFAMLAAFGALIGYCVGALAAGFFLVMDVIDQYLPGGREAPATPTHPRSKTHP